MKDSFDLVDIQNLTGITVQRLRYVLDQRLLPGESGPSWRRGRGTPRRFTPFSAFGLACTALLLTAGLRKSVVRSCIGALCEYTGDRKEVASVPLYQAFQERSTAYLEIGDGKFVRLVGSEDYLRHPLMFGWVDVTMRAASEMYEPLVTLRIDVARLRRLLGNRPQK
jgi:hypothetical protein